MRRARSYPFLMHTHACTRAVRASQVHESSLDVYGSARGGPVDIGVPVRVRGASVHNFECIAPIGTTVQASCAQNGPRMCKKLL